MSMSSSVLWGQFAYNYVTQYKESIGDGTGDVHFFVRSLSW
jgi:hypothetical protein